MIVNDLIVDHFPEIVDLGFTARMEEELDEIAEGHAAVGGSDPRVLRAVRRASGAGGRELMPEVKAEPEVLDRLCPETRPPPGHPPRPLRQVHRLLSFPGVPLHRAVAGADRRALPGQDGGDLVERRTRSGRVFYGCANYPACDFTSWKRPLPQPCPNCGGTVDGRQPHPRRLPQVRAPIRADDASGARGGGWHRSLQRSVPFRGRRIRSYEAPWPSNGASERDTCLRHGRDASRMRRPGRAGGG